MFQRKYAQLCAERNLQPRSELLTEHPPIVLKLNGNCAERFSNRVTDTEVALLCSTIDVGQAHVEEIDFSYNQIGNGGAEVLAHFLRRNTTVKHIDLSFNEISAKGGRALADALLLNSTLTSINLHGNDIGDEGGQAIATLLQANNTLRVLNIGSCGLRTVSLIALATALQSQPSLTEISIEKPLLPGVQEGLTIAQHLGNAIKLNGSLTELNLSRFKLNDEMFEMMTPCFVANTGLRNLNFCADGLSVQCGQHLARILRKRPDLVTLNLRSNQLGDEGAIRLCEALASHPSLITLDLRSNRLGERGLIAVARMLLLNDTILHLWLWDNEFTPAVCAELHKIRERFERLATTDVGLDDTGAVFLKSA